MISSEIPLPTKSISDNDEMMHSNIEHYLSVGESAMQSILIGLRAAGRQSCDAILDLPSGHGRVMRWLRAKFPSAHITACDLNRDGVDWCAQTFGARPVYSAPDIHAVQLHETYDLIWCGSLLTHLDWAGWRAFVQFFSNCLNPEGILVFSTHGRLSAEWLHTRQTDYGLEPEVIPDIIQDYRESGFGYRNYSYSQQYGISIAAPQRVVELVQSHPELRIVGYTEAAWDHHQDIVVCSRRTQPLVDFRCLPQR
jgi:SAM-dependent methyltransferase